MSITSTTTTATAPEIRPRVTLVAATLVFFVITLDAVIVNVALPSIRDELGGGIGGLQWIVDGYTLLFAALLLSCGSLTDRIGAKRVLVWGTILFVLASIACALAPSMTALVAARLVQGSAAAAMMPSSMSLLNHAHPDPV
ncbi:MFS family permease [Gordonia hydrophobica]|nr:MFS family permease [Gordonia hydrophobica]